jgi:hypothetical protein
LQEHGLEVEEVLRVLDDLVLGLRVNRDAELHYHLAVALLIHTDVEVLRHSDAYELRSLLLLLDDGHRGVVDAVLRYGERKTGDILELVDVLLSVP